MSRRLRLLRPATAAASSNRHGIAGRLGRGALVFGLALSASCGSEESEPVAQAEPRTEQKLLTPDEWQAELTADSALSALAGAAGGTLQASGVIEGPDGAQLIWGEYAADTDTARTGVQAVFRYLDKTGGTAQHGTASHTPTAATLAGLSGTSVAIGAPVLGKRLLEHNLKKGLTVLVPKGLERADPVDALAAQADLAAIPSGKRSLHVISAYGPAVGVDHGAIEKAATATGHYDEIQVLYHARRTDVLALLPRLTALDAVVWIGAGVIDTFSDGKPDKSIGMTLSRGVFGDELISRDTVKGLLDHAALGGPGLIVLVGSDSLTSDHPTQTGLLAQELQNVPWRVVVGFDGAIDLKGGEAATAALLDALAGGKSLADAIAAGTAKAGGAEMTTALDATLAPDWKLPPKKAAFWEAAPSGGKLRMYLKVTPKCVEAVGGTCDLDAFKAGKVVPAEQLTAGSAIYECDVTFDGPWFHCAQKNDVIGAEFEVRGFLRGRTAAEGVFLVAVGSPDKKVRGVTVIGEGVIEGVDQGGGGTTIRFGGPAAASPYVDGAGRCCVAISPLLVGQKATEQVSTLQIQP